MVSRRSGQQQFDLFVPYVADLPLRDQRETMERPFFSLSKRKRLKAIEYTSPDRGVFVNVYPNPEFGMATIWDADILIWAASNLNELRKRGLNDLPRTLPFHPYDLLKTICRDIGGREYRLLREALGRLQATSIVTNIRVTRGKKHRQFSWIESWTDVQDENGASRGMTLTLSDWLYEGILMDGGLLSIDPTYFSITGGRERWLYRVARKHAGGAGSEGFAISLPTLFEKSGAEGTYRRFKFELQAIVRDDALPHFSLVLEYGRGEPVLRMTRREGANPIPETATAGRPIPSGTAAAPPLPCLQGRTPSGETLDRMRRDFPGWDLFELQAKFDAWVAHDDKRSPTNYDAAFYGFVRRCHTREG
ncbi:MAG: replication initiator protein A [Acetobacteraceae bacterium]|nr:replication initiator protein A [Acetobacteraceae bacterium]